MKILIIDDHAILREGLKSLLTDWDGKVEIFEANNAGEATKLVKEINNLDLILLDLALPDVKGYELLESLETLASGIPIAVLSVTDRPSVIENVLRLGAKGYIPKSASPEVMKSAINLIMSGGIYVPPSLLDLTGEVAGPRKTDLSTMTIQADGSVHSLTDRQLEIIELLLHGKTNKEIGLILSMSPATVRSHLTVIFRQLNVKNRTEAVHVARRAGLISEEFI